jgi:pimeloyl-ACP methyl ester carboxylesterase
MAATRRRFLTTTAAATGGALLWAPDALIGQPRKPLGDVVVLIPGIMGSVLRKDGRDLWALSGSAILTGLRTLGGSVKDLALTGDSPDRDDLGDGIDASAIFPDTHLLPGFWKIDGYTTIGRAITGPYDAVHDRNYFEFPYDWRRDNRAAARRLAKLSAGWLRSWREQSGNKSAKLILVAHSMGGLVSRYFLEVLGGWRDTRMLITFGTPYRGSLNALAFLANGLRKSIGPLTLLDWSSLLRSFTSVYQLLPIYPCYDSGAGQLDRVGEVSGIPNVDDRRARAALDFHNEIRKAVEANAKDDVYLKERYTLHPIVGTCQPTLQIGRRAGNSVEMLERHPKMSDLQGDGTVPERSATPVEPDVFTKHVCSPNPLHPAPTSELRSTTWRSRWRTSMPLTSASTSAPAARIRRQSWPWWWLTR